MQCCSYVIFVSIIMVLGVVCTLRCYVDSLILTQYLHPKSQEFLKTRFITGRCVILFACWNSEYFCFMFYCKCIVHTETENAALSSCWHFLKCFCFLPDPMFLSCISNLKGILIGIWCMFGFVCTWCLT